MHNTYPLLFRPGKIGRLTLKNRAVMSPMGTDFANPDGTASDRLISYYEARAKGGIGLIINEYTGVDEIDSIPTVFNLRAASDKHLTALERLADAVHRHGAKIFAQLHHGGSTSKSMYTGRQSLSASDVPFVPGAPAPRAMTLDEIKAVQEKFLAAAIRCKNAGYDGVELHGAHSYLIGQFFSPYYNKRTDAYGGSLENRMRFVDEIIAMIKAALPNFPVTVRICGDEMTPHIEGTLTLEDGLQMGKHLEAQGIDAIHISNGSAFNANANCDPYSYRPGWKKHVAKAFKEMLSIPVIATNTIKMPDYAESLLEEGVSDFVSLGRSQIADPDWVNKAKFGKENEIRPCIGCMYCRACLLGTAPSVACAVNARMGREHSYGELKKDGNGKPFAVIGGGVAGMEAARVLAMRGFKVTLFEKENALGGAVNLAAIPPLKEGLNALVSSMKAQIESLGVDVRLNCSPTVKDIEAMSPAGVFVATGAKPIIPRVDGIDAKHVVTAESVLKGDNVPTGKVVVIGSGLTGLETAETLLEKGLSVTVIEMQKDIGPGIFAVIRNDLLSRLEKLGAVLMPSHALKKVNDNSVELESEGEMKQIAADSVVLAVGITPDESAKAPFVDAFPLDSVILGDAQAPGRIVEAIKTGYDAAWAL